MEKNLNDAETIEPEELKTLDEEGKEKEGKEDLDKKAPINPKLKK